MEKTLPTAAQFLNQDQELILDIIDGKLSYSIALGILEDKLIDFAKIHVEAALEAASDEWSMFETDEHNYLTDRSEIQNIKAILNAYPSNNIK